MSDNEKGESPIEVDDVDEDLKDIKPKSENADTAIPRKRARSEDGVNGRNGVSDDAKEDDEGDEEKGSEDGEGADDDEVKDDEERDDEDEDEDDDDEEGGTAQERRKKRRRRNKVNRFLDVEAEVDDEDEEEDDVDYEGDVAGFIDEVPEAAVPADEHRHRQLNRDFGRNEEMDVREIVRGIKERHGRSAAARYDADSDNIPQRLLMPSAEDPSLWRVRVKAGREQIIIATIFQKSEQMADSANPINIFSAFFRDSLPGSIFLEAEAAGQVTQAIHGIMGVFMGTPPALIPIEEMAPLLKIKKKDIQLNPGMWVRFRRGKHTGDLAQVVDVDQITSGVAGIKFLPRIDLTPKEKRRDRLTGKSLGASIRPPARPFALEEVRKIYGRGAARQGGAANNFIFDGDEYIDGFCYKDFKTNFLQTEDIKPTLEEISKFTGDDTNPSKIDLSAIMDANKMTTASGLVPGDRVEVHEGEQTGLYGAVETVTPDIVAIRAEGGDIHGQTIEVPARSVRKRFEVGEHVTVINGKNSDISGMVVEVQGDVVTLMSDQGEREIKVFSKDIRKAGDAATITQKTGLYDLHDLVMLDSTTAGVVIKIEGPLLRILDQNGISRMVSPNQVTARRESKNYAVGSDSQGNEFRVGDFMKETAGENRSGEVINIFRSLFVFLHNREVTDNNGVFVARSTALISVTPKSATNDLGKINPALNQALPYGGASLMPPPATNINKNRIVNTLVVVTKGTNKGLMGVIKDLQGDNARVELATNNKILTINLTSLKRKDPKTGQTYPLDTGMSAPGMGMSTGRPPMGGYDMNPYGGAPPTNGGATPAWGAGGGRTPAPGRFGQTPNPYATAAGGGFGGGKTPNPYAAGGRTPAGAGFGGGGGKTPGWAGGGGMGGRTPAYGGGDGGKTPAYGGAAAGGRTPAYGAPAGGGRTPAWAGGGAMDGRTPNPYAGPSGGRTPMPDASSSRYPPYAAPTPQSIPTRPTNPYAAPTPYDSGPTPYGSAPTPAGAPTPAAAPTPAVAGGPTPFSAPTPYGGAPTPFGGQPAAPGTARDGGLPWDWAMDFWNIIIEVGPSSRSGTKNPRHHQRGAIDGRRFGLQAHHDNDTIEIVALDDPTFREMLPSEYARPVRPDGSGQVCVTILGDNKGSQRTTQYENDGQWMMEMEPDDASQLVMDGQALCRIWRVGQE